MCKPNRMGRKVVGFIPSLKKSLLSLLEFFSGFIAFSTMPELAQKIKMFFALGPVTRLKYAKSPLIKLIHLPQRFLWVSSYFIPIPVHPKSH